MTDEAIERARERLREAAEGRPDAAAVDAALERTRAQVEELAAAAAQLESTPFRMACASRSGPSDATSPRSGA
jgi:hypothetical protein